jgi:hypothetical protein
MGTNPLRRRLEIIPDDPGPWSIVSFAREAQGAQLIGRGGRRRVGEQRGGGGTAPEIPLDRPGLDEALRIAGAGTLRMLAVHREGARSLYFEEDDTVLRGVHTRVIRRWSVPTLEVGTHEYPESDPAAVLTPPVPPALLAEPVEGEIVAPGGTVSAAPVKYGRLFGVAFLALPQRTVLRFIGGAACATWSADGQLLAFGGDWGVMLAEPAGR